MCIQYIQGEFNDIENTVHEYDELFPVLYFS